MATASQIWKPWGCALVFGLAGCASIPPPTEQMAVSRAAVSQAQNAGAAQHAPVELRNAQSKLDGATDAMKREEYEKAKRLAEQAEVDAKLAAVKADTARARAAVAELQEGIRVLRRELERRTN
jgi:Domain of unknown function (DUF4398)